MTATEEPGPSWADVLELIRQLDSSGLADAEVVTAGVSLRVSRSALTAPASSPSPASGQVEPIPVATTPIDAAPVAPASAAAGSSSPAPATGPEITAPMLGVLYHRSAPDQAPFVQVGDSVEPDTTVAIIEVMKLMNPVSAGMHGVIAEICVPDSAMVEFGDVLFRLKAEGAGT